MHHISEPVVTSFLKENGERTFRLFSLVFPLGKKKHQNISEIHKTWRCLRVWIWQQFLECGKANAYSADIEINISAHGKELP
jgi:hypothetical protein